jgi:hypothetical protein
MFGVAVSKDSPTDSVEKTESHKDVAESSADFEEDKDAERESSESTEEATTTTKKVC